MRALRIPVLFAVLAGGAASAAEAPPTIPSPPPSAVDPATGHPVGGEAATENRE